MKRGEKNLVLSHSPLANKNEKAKKTQQTRQFTEKIMHQHVQS